MPAGSLSETLTGAISGLPRGPWYLRRQVADLLGVTPSAITSVCSTGLHPECEPAGEIEWAGRTIHLWRTDSVEALRAHFTRDNRGQGRPRIWTLEESAERRRRLDRARYFRRRATELWEEGDEDGSNAAAARASELKAQLDEQERERGAARERS